MKKLNHIIGFKALLIMLMMFGMAHFASASITIAPTSPINTGTDVDATCSGGSVNPFWHIFSSGGTNKGGANGFGDCVTPRTLSGSYFFSQGDDRILILCDKDAVSNTCLADSTLAETRTDPGYVEEITIHVIENGCTDGTANNYSPSANNDDGSCTYTAGIGELIRQSNNSFYSTTGFPIVTTGGNQGVTNWAGDNLIKLFIGSGLALLFYLRFWIVALAIISAIVYFAYRAFQFFKH